MRGLRIAARLGLSLSRETEAAIRTLYSLVNSLGKVLKLENNDDTMLLEYGMRKKFSPLL